MVKALRTHVKLLTFTVFPELALAKSGRLLKTITTLAQYFLISKNR